MPYGKLGTLQSVTTGVVIEPPTAILQKDLSGTAKTVVVFLGGACAGDMFGGLKAEASRRNLSWFEIQTTGFDQQNISGLRPQTTQSILHELQGQLTLLRNELLDMGRHDVRFLVVGYSLGGVKAFHAWKILHELGQEVVRLVLIAPALRLRSLQFCLAYGLFSRGGRWRAGLEWLGRTRLGGLPYLLNWWGGPKKWIVDHLPEKRLFSAQQREDLAPVGVFRVAYLSYAIAYMGLISDAEKIAPEVDCPVDIHRAVSDEVVRWGLEGALGRLRTGVLTEYTAFGDHFFIYGARALSHAERILDYALNT